MWLRNNELSGDEIRTRSVYVYLKEELHRYLADLALTDSYHNFLKAGQTYPFVEKRELKPRAKVSELENNMVNSFIIIFTEGNIPQSMKKHIRYFDNNKVTKENLGELGLAGLNITDKFEAQQKYFETTKFYDLIRKLLPLDYALLIQKTPSSRHKNRFVLSHFHVRIDCLIDTAAESMGKQLRYISKDLYEQGEAYAQDVVEKLFEYYSFHHSVAGRRTAAMLAAQLLRQAPFFNSVFVSSSESRTLTMISPKSITKSALIQLSDEAIKAIENHPNGNKDFRKRFLIRETKKFGIAQMRAIYGLNEHSKPPVDGKLREIKRDVQWLRIVNQALVPTSHYTNTRPIRYQFIYDQQDPLS